MHAEITMRDKHGKPVRVSTDDGFAECSRPYDHERDGWIDKQLLHDDFEAIRTGRQMEQLVNMVNRLMRENFKLEQELKLWKKAANIF